MQVDREALRAAVNAANSIVDPNHSIPIFTKVWLFENHVLGFNANGMCIKIPCDVPHIGGIEGKLLVNLIDKFEDDELNIENDLGGDLTIEADETRINLARLEETESVNSLTQLPKLEKTRTARIEVNRLLDEVDWSAMLQLQPVQFETSVDFASVTFDNVNSKKTIVFTSDRVSINRTTVALDGYSGFRRLVPLEFMKTLVKLKEYFMEGVVTFDDFAIMVENDGAYLFCPLPQNSTGVDFSAAIKRIWPAEKLDSKIMTPVPDELKNIINQALLICKDDSDIVRLIVTDDRLTISSLHKGRGKFSASIDFQHSPVAVNVSCKRMLQALSHSTKMLLTNNAIAFRGPNQFWRFIASRS